MPAELQKHLVNLFFQTKQNLDKHLEEHGFIDFSKLLMLGVAFLANGGDATPTL